MIEGDLTAAGLARLIGVTERRVLTVKAEGRLPVTSTGRIDAVVLLRLGWGAALAAKGRPIPDPEPTQDQRAALRGLAPALDHTDPLCRGVALAVLAALHEAPVLAAIAAADAGVQRGQAEAVADVLVVALWTALNDHARAWGVPDAGGGPILATPEIGQWRAAVDWPALYDGGGASLATGQMRRQTEAAPG